MKDRKRWISLGMAGLLALAAPVTGWAGSPDFARTEEEWARLRDDVLEYGELEDLVHEYNATVQSNQINFNEFKREYGNTRDEISSKYRELADEIYASVDYPDTDDPTYGYMVASVLMAEIQAKNLEQQADDNLEDSEIIRLNYEQAEKTLVTVAQSNMIGYQLGQLSVTQAEVARDQAQLALTMAQARQASGAATQVDVLTAQEALMTAERNIQSAQSSMENARQKLQVMVGWKPDDRPVIEPVPLADQNRIAAMDPQADKALALENNYTLRVNKRKLDNADSASTREDLEKTIADNERKIGSALVTNYQNVLSAQLAYEQATADLALERRNLQSVTVQYQQGNVSRNQFDNEQFLVRTKELAVDIADKNLFQAMETYDWGVKGLANAS